MHCGAYWGVRPESRERAAIRIAQLIDGLRAGGDEDLLHWYQPAGRRKGKLKEVVLTAESAAGAFKQNHRDIGGEVIPELGFSLRLWNGKDVSLSATLGGYSKLVGNVMVLTFHGAVSGDPVLWGRRLRALIEATDPDHARVAKSFVVNADSGPGVRKPGIRVFLSYKRAEGIVEEEAFDR